MSKMKLEPCPFCGKPGYIDCTVEPHKHRLAVFMPDGAYYQTFVCCTGCSAGLCGEEMSTKKEAIQNAIKAWNTRVKEKP